MLSLAFDQIFFPLSHNWCHQELAVLASFGNHAVYMGHLAINAACCQSFPILRLLHFSHMCGHVIAAL